jgi:hypothetical protein
MGSFNIDNALPWNNALNNGSRGSISLHLNLCKLARNNKPGLEISHTELPSCQKIGIRTSQLFLGAKPKSLYLDFALQQIFSGHDLTSAYRSETVQN